MRGLVCPEPVVRTRKALETAGDRPVAVTTDSPESRDNIIRFAERSGCAVTWAEREPGIYVVKISKASARDMHGLSSIRIVSKAPNTVLFLSSDELGRGDEKLGRLLMTLFLRTLTELGNPGTGPGPLEAGRNPGQSRISLLLANNGVKLALEGSEHLPSLQTLEQQGVTIRVCGTCLDFFGVKDRVRAGVVSNMYELAEILLAGDKVMVF